MDERPIKERPILFTAENVNRTNAGKKTQTRRVMRVQPEPTWTFATMLETGAAFFYGMDDFEIHKIQCPYGKRGDRLWVRETHRVNPWIFHSPNMGPGSPGCVVYKADPHPAEYDEQKAWTPSIFMPRWASRTTLEIVRVRVERLQQITEEDAMAEGAAFRFGDNGELNAYNNLWNRINAKRGRPWESNPWVWVLEYRKL